MNWKRGSIAFFLSLLQPGLGHLYNRQAKRAALAAASTPVFVVGCRLLSLRHSFSGLLVFFMAAVLLGLWIALDAGLQGLRQLRDVSLPAMNRPFAALGLFFIAL